MPGGSKAGSLIPNENPYKTVEARSKSVIKEGHNTSPISLSISRNRSFIKPTPSNGDISIQTLIKKYPTKTATTKDAALTEDLK